MVLFAFLSDFDDFFAIVVATFGANAMGTDHGTTMLASDESGDFELEVAAAHSLPGFGDSSLRYCHCSFLLRTGKL